MLKLLKKHAQMTERIRIFGSWNCRRRYRVGGVEIIWRDFRRMKDDVHKLIRVWV
jgi:hypothetical protein